MVGVAEGGEAFGRAGPMEGRGGGGGDYGVVGVGVEGSVAAEGEDDVGAEVADALDYISCELGQAHKLEVGVLVVEHLVVVDAEEVAGGGELGATEVA